jgi:adenine-specific DNA-methyltransferase
MAGNRRKGKAGGDKAAAEKREADYRHPEAVSPLRPEVGTQAQFRKRKPPATYRYDSSLSPALDWDGQNAAREQGEAAIKDILDLDTAAIDAAATADDAKKAARAAIAKAKAAADKLKRLGKPFLDWTGKAERLSFDVPTLPLFVHERLSTKAIIETLKSHEKRASAAQADMFDLFGDPKRSVADQVLKAYEYRDKWVNRLILGDSLAVMNSLLHYEGLGGQVQMIYIDPPYGVKFGSNFQPFVKKHDVSHNDDEDMTREPEMVKAYRDTWELGLHSYLTYLRDRLLLARDLLQPSGSVFVQISDENLHHVRELMDEVFGTENRLTCIVFRKTTGAGSPSGYVEALPETIDYLLWYARDHKLTKINRLYLPRDLRADENFRWLEASDGSRRQANPNDDIVELSYQNRVFQANPLTSQTGGPTTQFDFEYEGSTYKVKRGGWKTNAAGMLRLKNERRLVGIGNTLRFIRYHDDFAFVPVIDVWDDTRQSGFGESKLYVVQTAPKVPARCLLMTTDPGDLILDPTCGGGTTAYVAEQWGRRWITVDTSRVPLALTRQRLLTATFPYFELKEEPRGPAGGFVYKRRQNKKGEDVGGIVSHVTLKSIANNEPPQEEVLVDRPEIDNAIVRVAGPFTVEATIPSPIDLDGDGDGAKGAGDDSGAAGDDHAAFVERMLEVLRKSPVLQVGGGKSVTLRNIRPPAKSLALSAEAMVEANGNGRKATSLQSAIEAAHERNTGGLPFSQRPVAIVFGPENGAVSEKLVFAAAREAHGKSYSHLYVIGFAIQANARHLIETAEAVVGIPATYVTATQDLAMGDLLKTMRSSQIFSVCGMPDIAVKKLKPEKAGAPPRYQAELLGFDVFDPVTMALDHRKGDDVPAWLLDTDYNGLVFHGSQVFFPRTAAWDNLKKALRATHDEAVWDHLAGTVSAPFEAGEHGTIAVKVIDDRGNELLVVKSLKDGA